MKKLLARIAAVSTAVLSAALMTFGASADYTYSFDDKTLITEIVSETAEINGSEITIEKELKDGETDDGMTIRLALFNEYLDAEFWNSPDVKVTCDVRLETEGANVIGYIPGFDTKWTWINPSKFTTLKYNEWVTITETGDHFYKDFSKNGPNMLLFQIRSNWGAGAQGKVKVTIRNFSIIGEAPAHEDTTTTTTATTTTAATTTQTTTTTASSAVEEPVIVSEESAAPAESAEVNDTADANSESAESTGSTETAPAPTEEAAAPASSSTANSTTATTVTTAATTIKTAAAPATSIDYSQYTVAPDASKSASMVIIIVIVVVGVIAAGVIIGYIIYRKKKFY